MSKINITPDEGYYGLGRVGITVAATDRDITENGVYEGLFRKITVSIDQHESEIAELEEQVANLETEITGLNNTITEKNQQIATLQADVTAKTEQITTLQGEVAELQAEVTTKTEQITTLQAEITTKNEQIATLQAEKETLQEQVTYMSNTEERVFTDNGEYTPSEGKYAMSKVTINVQGGSGKPEQEKDVVINKSGAVELETLNVTDNGTYNGYFNKVTVDVQGAGGDVWKKFDDYFYGASSLINSQGIIDLRNRNSIVNSSYLFAGMNISYENLKGILLPETSTQLNNFVDGGYVCCNVANYLFENNNIDIIYNSFNNTYTNGEEKEIILKGIKTISRSFDDIYDNEKIVFDNCISTIGESFYNINYLKEIKFKSELPGYFINAFNNAQGRGYELTVKIPYGVNVNSYKHYFSKNNVEMYGKSLTLKENKSGIVQCYNLEYIDIPYDVIFDYVNEDDCIPLSGSFEDIGVAKNVYVGKNTTGAARYFIQPVEILGVTVNIEIMQSTISLKDTIIGSFENSQQNIPTNFYYGNTITQSIYSKELLEEYNVGTGEITKLTYFAKQYNGRNCKTKIYLGNSSTISSFGDGVEILPDDDLTLVFDGVLTLSEYPNTEGYYEYEIELDRPFEYSGDNLFVCLNDYTNSYTQQVEFYYTPTSNYSLKSTYRDGEIYTDFSEISSASKLQNLPTIKIRISNE